MKFANLTDLLAAVQPFNPSDPKFQKSAEEILHVPSDKILRYVSSLEDAGILLRRGHLLRVVPDLLADYIRASAAYDEKGQIPTRYADRIFGALRDELATNLLVNISQLDWRLSTDGVRASLLNEVWSGLKEQFTKAKIYERASMLDAIIKVSYYQPKQALDFVQLAIAEPTDEVEADLARLAFTKPSYQVVLEKIPPILRYVAYDTNYLIDALDILKELAEKDNRPTNSYPNHPVRVLQEIASIEPGKPIAFNNAVATHAIGWLREPSAGNFSPFDVLDELLKTEGHQDESRGFQVILRAFKVNPEAVSGLRERIIIEAFNIVNKRPFSEAMRALRTLSAALSYPIGVLGQNITAEEKAAWDPGILLVMKGLQNIVANPEIDPYISAEIRGMVSWFSNFGGEVTKTAAGGVLSSIPETLDYEVSRALVDAWGRTFYRSDDRNQTQDAMVQWRNKVANDLILRYKERLSELLKFLEDRITVLNSAKPPQRADIGVFLGALMEASPAFTDHLGKHLLENPSSPLAGLFGIVVVATAKRNRSASLELAQGALSTGEQILIRGSAWALGWGDYHLQVMPEEIEIMKRLALSPDQGVRMSIIQAIKRFPKETISSAWDILLSIDITDSGDVTGEVLGTLEEKDSIFKKENLTDHQLQRLLDNLVKCPLVDHYNIALFLRGTSFTHPWPTLKMLMQRVEYMEANQKLVGYDPLPSPLREIESLRFAETVEYEQILRAVRDWATVPTGNWIRINYGRDLFKLVSAGFDEVTLKILQEWIMSADEHELQAAASLLQEARRTFVWDKQEFVINLLDQAQKYGSACYKRVCSSLYASVIQGFRSGTPGQPFPEDIDQRDRSFSIISQLPPGSPAHKFYKMLYEDALAKIGLRAIDEEEFA